jgi:hypothetical protein
MFKAINFMDPKYQDEPRSIISPLVLALLAMQQNQQQGQAQNQQQQIPEDYLQYLLRQQGEEENDPYTPFGSQEQMMTRARRPSRFPNSMEGFEGEDTGDLMSKLRQRESGGNYGITNSLGYTGAYQFGAPALETVGFLKPGAGKQGNKALNDPENWTIPGGLEQYKSNPAIQDEAMRRLMNSNKQTLTKMGLINQNTSPQNINGMLAAAHLSGPGGVKKMMRGGNPRDAYGTGAREYYNLGRGTR